MTAFQPPAPVVPHTVIPPVTLVPLSPPHKERKVGAIVAGVLAGVAVLVTFIGGDFYVSAQNNTHATATAQTRSQQTAVAQATATVIAQATATIQTMYALSTAAPQHARSTSEPSEGTLYHKANDVSLSSYTFIAQNFSTHVQFLNPYAASEHGWDFGIVFRITSDKHYDLIVTSKGEWSLTLVINDTQFISKGKGSFDGLNASDGGSNRLDLYVQDSVGYFYINNTFVSILDVADHMDAGNIQVGTSFMAGNQIPGKVTSYANFNVAILS